MISIQNVCGKAILTCLIPILAGVIYMITLSALRPCKGRVPINEVKEVLIHLRFNIVHLYQECAEHGKKAQTLLWRLIWVYAILNAPVLELLHK